MRLIIIAGFLFTASTCFSQNSLQINVCDIHKKPIPYASVFNKQKHTGLYSDSTGKFSLPIEFALTDTLLVSSIGYISYDVVLKDIKGGLIYLKLKMDTLKEVFIKSNSLERTYGAQKETTSFVSSISDFGKRNEMALFFENKDNIDGKIISVSFYISNLSMVNCPFRVRIYKSKDGHPSEDILVDDLIVNYKKKSNWLEIFVDKYVLPFNHEGVFLSIESLYGLKKSGFYTSTNITNGKLITHYGQSLGLTDEYDTAVSYQREFNGIWKPFSVKFPDNLSTKTFYPMMRIKVK